MSTQSSEEQSISPNAEGVSAGNSGLDEQFQTPPGSDERLIELAVALKRGDYGAWDDDWLVGKFNEATDRLRSLLGEREADKEALNVALKAGRAVVAEAEASLLRVTEERGEDLVMTGCRDTADLRDMANVGKSLLDAIASIQFEGSPYQHWMPADDPAEIVTDLLNDLEEQRASLSALRGEVGKVLRRNVQTFRLYETLHAEKNTLEGNAKAAKNAAMAELNASLLSTLEGNDSIVSRASLPAHVAEATATEALSSNGIFSFEAQLAERRADPAWIAKWNAAEDDARPFHEMLNDLRRDEGSAVTLLCDNPDFNGQPNNAIECVGGWTDWQERRFTGETLHAALKAAYLARRTALSSEAPSPRDRGATDV